MYETINSPINYGGLELKNRIIFAPTTFGLAEDEYFEKIRKIAAGGCAMVIIGDVPVGKSQFEKSLFDKKGFAYYQKLAEIVHSYDCRSSSIEIFFVRTPGTYFSMASILESVWCSWAQMRQS